MKKVIFGLLFVAVIILVRGCGDKEPEITFDKIESNLPELKEFYFDRGAILDEESSRTLSFEPVQVRPGLMLERTIVLNESDGIEWTLAFESSDFDGEYIHIENIPKSFAEDVSQIEFSLEPDKIIDADPSVAWIMNISEGLKTSIKMKVGLEYFLGGTDGAIMSLVENFNDVEELYKRILDDP